MERIESNRNFANKLWNAGKYLQNVLSSLSKDEVNSLAVDGPLTANELATVPLAEKYIISTCHNLINDVTNDLETYNFGEAGRRIYEFLWDEYADWYIEISKIRMRDPVQAKISRRVLVYVWDSCLKLLHPFMPFLTETLWQLSPHKGDSIMIADWPQTDSIKLASDNNAINGFKSLQALVRSIRNARAEYNVEAGKKIGALIRIGSNVGTLKDSISNDLPILGLLARLDDSLVTLEILDKVQGIPPPESLG